MILAPEFQLWVIAIQLAADLSGLVHKFQALDAQDFRRSVLSEDWLSYEQPVPDKASSDTSEKSQDGRAD